MKNPFKTEYAICVGAIEDISKVCDILVDCGIKKFAVRDYGNITFACYPWTKHALVKSLKTKGDLWDLT